MDSDPYFSPRPESRHKNRESEPIEHLDDQTQSSHKSNVYDELIYHVDKHTGHYRICVPADSIQEILQTTHNDGHPGFDKCFDSISRTQYIRHLARYLRDFLRHCPECLVYQTRRHRLYGVLEPIQSPLVPFYIIAIDYVLALPKTDDGLNTVLSVTDKFSKRVTFIPRAGTQSAAIWAIALLDRLAIANQGLPSVIISDRDRKFLSELWTAIFTRLRVNLLYSIAYHPQTNRASERTNQLAKIAMRFYLNTLPNLKNQPVVLLRLQAILNNTSNSTEHTANEVFYSFALNKPLDLAILPYKLPTKKARISAANAISFAQMSQKFHYNRRHQAMFIKPGDRAYLRLYKGYLIPANAGVKKVLSQQYVGPFDIIRRVGSQAYKLRLPDYWRIHPVISVAMLEPAPPGNNPYDRPVPDHPELVHVEGDTKHFRSYEIERLINRQIIRKGRGFST